MRRVLATLLLSWVVGGPASPLRAQDEPVDAPEAPERPAAELVREGNERFADGALDEALGFYDRARNQAPDSAELAFNRGLTHFKLGNLEQAGELLNRAVGSADGDVEADSKFMLGNVQHLRAVQAREQDPRAAMDALEQATSYYLDALAVQPENEELRGNIELAQNLMELIREEQQQQQQDQQPNQEQQQQDGDEQESEQQPDQGQEQEEDPEQQQDEQDPESEEQETPEGEQQEEQEQEQQSQESSGEQDGPEEGEEQQTPQPAEPKEGEEGEARRLPPEQIERMMQQIRDKERQRRQQKAEQARRRAGTVKKDW